ncbi:c-type cytochrome [Paenibacillus hexagrammi]|uniref:Cytochrome c n=1 Tax=Paenibacillus hexagrammi TaxID=2908839 RepID=A0ABY3SFN2_9BACL|nr:cytochrome c [Paenibacillus sp. YPD9-1]UJF32819.1 cytochrome c [Paenibacillus sp. YPD9-1]
MRRIIGDVTSTGRLLACTLLAAAVMAALTGCGGKNGGAAASPGAAGTAGTSAASPAATQTESNPAFVKAQELFTVNKCISCHGVDLEGKVGPKTNLQKVGAAMSKEQIAAQIANGGGGMPAYKTKLSEDEIGQLTDWLSSKK